MSEKSLEELEFEETGVTRKERWKVMWASIVGYAMDGLDVLILSFAMAAIVAEFGLTLGEGGLIATYTLIGTVLGGYLFGVFADYFGRVHTFALTIIIFSIFTGACAFADNVMHLNILRFFAGLGLGGEYGIGMTLVTETWPAAKRARATAGVAMGWQAGAVLAAILAAVVLPDYGWRGLFLVGVIPALLAAWARHGLKEPPMWLKRKELKKQLKARKAAGETLTAEEEAELTGSKQVPAGASVLQPVEDGDHDFSHYHDECAEFRLLRHHGVAADDPSEGTRPFHKVDVRMDGCHGHRYDRRHLCLRLSLGPFRT